MDCRFGIVSQMMQKIHIEKAQPQYCSNVCMKVNAKLGGCTSRIAGKDMKTAKPFFQVPTMVIGADVSHAAPGSPQASMAAITMSMDQDACRYAAAVQTNGRRVEMISSENWKSMFMPLFEIWKTNIGRGQGPQHIYYFRDGVSEGQFFQVLNSEVADMKKAIYGAYPKASIKFTVIVCTKRHHIRFLPKEGDSIGGDRNGNPNPGTLVERDVTHPHEYDFYLNSHSAIQGTARPVHYQVILDEAAILPSKLHAMIYEHCYQYMRSTTPVSLCKLYFSQTLANSLT
jgi:eukaryotic translation initiation factor 2C